MDQSMVVNKSIVNRAFRGGEEARKSFVNQISHDPSDLKVIFYFLKIADDEDVEKKDGSAQLQLACMLRSFVPGFSWNFHILSRNGECVANVPLN